MWAIDTACHTRLPGDQTKSVGGGEGKGISNYTGNEQIPSSLGTKAVTTLVPRLVCVSLLPSGLAYWLIARGDNMQLKERSTCLKRRKTSLLVLEADIDRTLLDCSSLFTSILPDFLIFRIIRASAWLNCRWNCKIKNQRLNVLPCYGSQGATAAFGAALTALLCCQEVQLGWPNRKRRHSSRQLTRMHKVDYSK